VTLTSGYWHGSPPRPLTLSQTYLECLAKARIPLPTDVEAPRGGRAGLMRSEDDWLTSAPPEPMIDTPWDDCSPAAVQLSDGTLVSSFFVWPGLDVKRVGIMRSNDDGKTWDAPRYLAEPFKWAAGSGPPVEMPDGSALFVAYRGPTIEENDGCELGVYRSTERGDTWKCISILKAPFDLNETSVTRGARWPAAKESNYSRTQAHPQTWR
jgi:hypothetical protein